MKMQSKKRVLPVLAAVIGLSAALASASTPKKPAQQAWGRNAANECVAGEVEDECGLISGAACSFNSGGQTITAHSSQADCANPEAVLRKP